jgi:hypothetical protein
MATSTDAQNSLLRERLFAQYKWGLRPVTILLALLGILILIAWYLTNDNSTMSMLLMLAGISIIVLSFMLYFLTPTKYLRSDVADAMALANTQNIGRLLSSMLIESKGIIVPVSEGSPMKLFLPISSNVDIASIGDLRQGSGTFNVSSSGVRGITLQPPGYELLRYAKNIGAVFTPEGLENEIKDVIVNGLELASSVDVRQDGGKVIVVLRHVADKAMCASIRNDSPNICQQLGCPICSLVGCMIVSGTGRKARIESTKVINDTVTVTYELL